MTSAPASQRTWPPHVPDHWDVKAIRRVFVILNGSTPKSGEPSYWDGSIAWATPDDLGDLHGDTLSSTRRTITEEGYRSCGTSLAPAGSLVLSTRAPIGHVAIAGTPVCTNQGCRTLVLRNTDSERFQYYQLVAARSELESWGQGATFAELSRDRLAALHLAVPPLDEQRAIAAILDRETARIDALIEKKRRQIELLHEKRAALISHAVTKGLDPTVPMKDSGIDWIGTIPSQWTVARVKHVARLESGHTPSRGVPEHWLDSNDIPWVSLNDTKWLAENDWISDTTYNINALGLQNSSARLLPARVVVFTRDATIGKAAITARPMAVSQHLIAWVCGPRVLPDYLLRVFYAMEPALERYTFGATIKTIGMDDVRTLVMPLPPLDEQLRIVDWIGPRLERIAAMVRKIELSIDCLREYRTAVISAAVTGKIDVRQEVA